MAQKRETVVVDELAAAVEAIVANSRKTSNLVSRFAVYNERLGQDRSKMPEFEAIEEARLEAGLQELTSAARLLNVAWGTPESRRRLAAITARAGEASRLATLEALPSSSPTSAGGCGRRSRGIEDEPPHLPGRGYCTRGGYARLDEVLGQLCDLGNAALQERRCRRGPGGEAPRTPSCKKEASRSRRAERSWSCSSPQETRPAGQLAHAPQDGPGGPWVMELVAA